MDAVSLMYMTFVLVVSIAILGTIIPIYKKPIGSVLEIVQSTESDFFAEFIATNLIQYIYRRRSNFPQEYDRWEDILDAMRIYGNQTTEVTTPLLVKDPMFLLSVSIIQCHEAPVTAEIAEMINEMTRFIRKEILIHELHCGNRLNPRQIAKLVSSHPIFDVT